MENLKEKIEDLANYDQCVHVPPLFFAQILEELRILADSTELSDFTRVGVALPKHSGAFVYNGVPAHMRAVEHNNSMYLIFCAFHNGTSGNSGCAYLLYMRYDDGTFRYASQYTSSSVPDWIKRTFNECTATASYPGLLSATMYKKLEAVYNYCVSKGMTAVS